MNSHARHFAVLLGPLLLLAGCGGGPTTSQRLDDRLQALLAPDVAAGNATVEPLPNGARVTLLGPSRFPLDERALDDQRRDVRASVVEGLLDPSLMQIQLADTSALPDAQRDMRVRNMARYFEAYELGSILQPAVPPQAIPPGAPAGLTITINVQCPQRHDGDGYGSGRSKPVCD